MFRAKKLAEELGLGENTHRGKWIMFAYCWDILDRFTEMAGRQPRNILDYGFGYGTSTLFWLKQTKAKITTIDVCEMGKAFNTNHVADISTESERERLTFHKGRASEIIPGLGGKFDIIFNDAGHDKFTHPEIVASWEKLRKPGILFGHDYFTIKHVANAADKFKEDMNIDMETISGPDRNGIFIFTNEVACTP